jgi:tetratricopeptide (TPR) repeat protein
MLALVAPAAWAVVYDPATAPAPGAPVVAASANPQAQAALEGGLAALKEAEGLDSAAPAASAKPKELPPALKDAYTRARSQFQAATQADATIAEAWNGLGYSQRKLGDYKTALASYARALSLKPGYPEATEYRGEAYLGLNRLDDAKRAYLDLFATNRSLAERLLGAMKRWVDGNDAADKSAAADLAKWIEERSQIAAQTASLTREGTSAGWR